MQPLHVHAGCAWHRLCTVDLCAKARGDKLKFRRARQGPLYRRASCASMATEAALALAAASDCVGMGFAQSLRAARR
jgi:hypothetical protein